MLLFIPDGANAMISLITSKVKELSSGIGESQISEASMAVKDEQEWSNIHVDVWNLDVVLGRTTHLARLQEFWPCTV